MRWTTTKYEKMLKTYYDETVRVGWTRMDQVLIYT